MNTCRMFEVSPALRMIFIYAPTGIKSPFRQPSMTRPRGSRKNPPEAPRPSTLELNLSGEDAPAATLNEAIAAAHVFAPPEFTVDHVSVTDPAPAALDTPNERLPFQKSVYRDVALGPLGAAPAEKPFTQSMTISPEALVTVAVLAAPDPVPPVEFLKQVVVSDPVTEMQAIAIYPLTTSETVWVPDGGFAKPKI